MTRGYKDAVKEYRQIKRVGKDVPKKQNERKCEIVEFHRKKIKAILLKW